MDDICAPSVYRERYREVIGAVQRRPLDGGREIHAWVSLKQDSNGRSSNSFYVSPELFRPIRNV
ncbi:hypothetical protein F5Y13DRAFT_164184 [Hypoxylon sp. FL1857]|nr:hypothetical protein F5Y13DRAFT_164184 [Hypoxylon sp. FL1857]